MQLHSPDIGGRQFPSLELTRIITVLKCITLTLTVKVKRQLNGQFHLVSFPSDVHEEMKVPLDVKTASKLCVVCDVGSTA